MEFAEIPIEILTQKRKNTHACLLNLYFSCSISCFGTDYELKYVKFRVEENLKSLWETIISKKRKRRGRRINKKIHSTNVVFFYNEIFLQTFTLYRIKSEIHHTTINLPTEYILNMKNLKNGQKLTEHSKMCSTHNTYYHSVDFHK